MDLMSKPSAQSSVPSSSPQLGYCKDNCMPTVNSATTNKPDNSESLIQQHSAPNHNHSSTLSQTPLPLGPPLVSATSTPPHQQQHQHQQLHSSASYLSQQQQLQFESSLKEIYKYKSYISQKIKQLESLIGRLKSIVLIYDNEFNNCLETMNTGSHPKVIRNKESGIQQPNQLNSSLNQNKVSVHSNNLVGTKPSSSSNLVPSSASVNLNGPKANSSMEELRTILSDIDSHLAVLKDIEDRHAMICEEYSKEIRVRDDTITTKAEQISYMNHELVGLQNQINFLTMKNHQLETEITYIKSNSTSLANTEVSTTPSHNETYSQEQTVTESVFNLADHGYTSNLSNITQPNKANIQETDQNAIKLDQVKHFINNIEETSNNSGDSDCSIRLMEPNSKLEPDLNRNNSSGQLSHYQEVSNKFIENINKLVENQQKKTINIGIEVINKQSADKNYEQLYRELAAQYKHLETLIWNKQYPFEELKKSNNRTIQSPKPSMTNAVNNSNKNLSTMAETSMVIDMNKADKTLDIDEIEPKTEVQSTKNEHQSKSFESNLGLILDGNNNSDSSNNPTPTNENDLHFKQEVIVEDETESLLSQEILDDDRMNKNVDSGVDVSIKADDIGLTQQAFERHHFEQTNGEQENDVVATSIKAYEHFVKMQHDLETLMKNEEKHKNKIEDLNNENEDLRKAKEDEEFKLSEVQYELDILKHNYNLEIESFSTAVNERESLIEKLQEKVESLKKRFLTLDEKFRNCIEKEVQYKSTIEEFEGRISYEQIQKQTVIDSRVHELENKLNEAETEYQVEINNLRTDLACKISIEKELQSRIEELENTVRANGTADGYEEEFGYYKSQIDSIVKELETEKQDKQRLIDKYEDESRLKDKQYDHLRDQARKEKDALLRDKNEIDQKFRKLMSKFKVKEREILSLQEKLQLLNDKFRNRPLSTTNNNNSRVNQQDKLDGNEPNDIGDEQSQYKCEEQMMTEMALNEAKMFEIKGKLEDSEDRLIQINADLSKERNRRRELETYYLGSLNHRYNPIPQQIRIENRQDDWNSSGDGPLGWNNAGHRNSTSSLALLMDENDKDLRDTTLYSSLTRSIRQQKNILMFGGPNAKLIRICFLLYLVVLHYFAVEYYLT